MANYKERKPINDKGLIDTEGIPQGVNIDENGNIGIAMDGSGSLIVEPAIGVAFDVALQDQHTPAVIQKFNRVTNGTTLASAATLGDRQITVTSATGISVGSHIILFDPASERFSTMKATGIGSAPIIDIDGPLDFAYPAGTYIDIAVTNMGEDGSTTPLTFGLRGVGTPPGVDLTVDITRIIFTCITDGAVDLSLFADQAVLTNGLLLRKRDGEVYNIFNVKSNKEMAGLMYDWQAVSASNPQQGVNGFIGRLTFASQGKIGVTQRLAIGEDLEFIIQDDLSDITLFEVIAEGHIVED